MTRFLLALGGVVLLAVTALGVIWLAGQLLVGLGALAVGTAGILLKLLWFLVTAGLLGGAVYFVSNAWRPSPSKRAERPVSRPSQVTAISANLVAPELHKEPGQDLQAVRSHHD